MKVDSLKQKERYLAWKENTKEDSGNIIRDLFYSGGKTKIKEYVEKEFVFQELFEKIRNSGLIKNLQ